MASMIVDYDQEIEKFKKKFTAAGKPKEYVGHKKKGLSVSWSPNGEKVATSSQDHTIRIWPIEKRQREYELKGHTDAVMQINWNPATTDVLASASYDKSVRIWDVRTAKMTKNISTGAQNTSVAWFSDGNYVAVTSKEDVKFYDLRTGKSIKVLKTSRSGNTRCTWSKDGKLFLFVSTSGHVIATPFNPNNTEPVPSMSYSATASPIYAVETDPASKYFALGCGDSLASLWEMREMTCLRTFGTGDTEVRCVSFSGDGQVLALGYEDGLIELHHVESGEKLHEFKSDVDLCDLAWHPKNLQFAFIGEDREGRRDGTLRIWG
jgi:THO complex subunit 3